MDITKFVVSSREKALLYGDYATYRTQLAGRLLNCRKKLNIATKHRGKFHQKAQPTPEQLAENHEFVTLQLLTAERAWAHAMTMKTAHAADTKGISGRARSHIVSRLDKAARTAEKLADTLAQEASGASDADVLEARAYAAMLRGAALFEKQSWEPCLRSYATARVIYSALASSAKADLFKDLLSETIDPSIRYAAYQLKTPRTLPIPAIALKAFPRPDTSLVARLEKVEPGILKQGGDGAQKEADGSEGAPRTLTWRGREVRIEDAAISVAWGSVGAAREVLEEKVAASSTMGFKDMAVAYDDILIASQDAVDATKQAIEELRAEGVSESDQRMQSLQITRTAVNYEMISWRIGRNRVLTGHKDGALWDAAPISKRKAAKQNSATTNTKQEPPSRQVARLKEKVVLYDGTLQSLESIKELPGVAADEGLSSQVDATVQYFTALKSLAVARSHSLTHNPANALALTKHAGDECSQAVSAFSQRKGSGASPLRNMEVSSADVHFLCDLLKGELQRSRALVEVARLRKQAEKGTSKGSGIPLVERLGEYPAEGVDLDNIVVYPPKVDVMPVKPLFLDVAWNYIQYPDQQSKAEVKSQEKSADKPSDADQKPLKKGWFGFGR